MAVALCHPVIGRCGNASENVRQRRPLHGAPQRRSGSHRRGDGGVTAIPFGAQTYVAALGLDSHAAAAIAVLEDEAGARTVPGLDRLRPEAVVDVAAECLYV